ncbi:MAG: glutathione peroxidase [Acidimicrobiales bacterium]
MSIYDIPLTTLGGHDTTLAPYQGQTLLIVNVASKCGLTPQYEGLERLHETYHSRGFNVIGFPCDQFHGQEPGTADEIATFCSTTYGVTFPMMAKVEVNGEGRHPLFEILTQATDAKGRTGNVVWNFEKFLVHPDASIARFEPLVDPEDPSIVDAIKAALG